MSISKWLSLLFILIMLACTRNPVALDGFDRDLWESDRNACNSDRIGMKDNLVAQKEKLLGLDEMEIIRALGMPDQREIYKRNEKFFYYYLQPSPACDTPSTQAQRLAIRFNAVGLAKEISVE